MKNFVVFSFDHYYPAGGLDDISGSFDSLEEAVAFVLRDDSYSDYNYVVDASSWEIVYPPDLAGRVDYFREDIEGER